KPKAKPETDEPEVVEEEADAEADNQSDETEEEVVGKEWLGRLEPDDLIFWVKEVHSVEYLKELAKALAKELAKTLPLPPPLAPPAGVVAPAPPVSDRRM